MSDVIAAIKAGFDLDRRRQTGPVVSANELPLSYEAITDRWLTDILCQNHPGAKVVSFTLGPPDNGSSNRRTIQVEYNEAGHAAGLPTSLFCKASHDLLNRTVLGTSGGAYTEAVFYNKLRPLLNIEAPTGYFARFDAETFNSMIVLGDISATVMEFCTDRTPMSRQRAESQLTLLAEFHGQGYGNARLRAELQHIATWPDFFGRTLAFGMEAGSNRGFLAAEHVIPPRLYRRFEEIWPKTLQAVDRHKHLPHTLAHGDVHLKNWYVAGSGAMGLGDWQCAGRGHWGRDVAYAIATAVIPDDRRAWERDLLRFYLERMRAAGGPAVSFEEAWNHYRQQLISALTWWTITLTPPAGLPDMQPQDTSLEFIRRITTAMDDVDSLASLA